MGFPQLIPTMRDRETLEIPIDRMGMKSWTYRIGGNPHYEWATMEANQNDLAAASKSISTGHGNTGVNVIKTVLHPAQLDYDNRFKPTDIDKALEKVKVPPSTVLAVIPGIRDFEGQLVRAMKGLSQACVFYAKLLMVCMSIWRSYNPKRQPQKDKLWFSKQLWRNSSCRYWKVGYMHGLLFSELVIIIF